MAAQMKFALMLWPTDKNLTSVIALNNIREPEKAFNDYDVGEECLTFYPRYPGPDGVSKSGEKLWKSIILAKSGSRQSLSEMRNRLVKEVQTKLDGNVGVTDEEVTAIILGQALNKDMSDVKKMDSSEKKRSAHEHQKEVCPPDEKKKKCHEKEKQTKGKKIKLGDKEVPKTEENVSKAKKKKITKALESLSEKKLMDELQQDLEKKEMIDLGQLEKELELAKQPVEMDVADVIEATRKVLYPQSPAEQQASWQPSSQNTWQQQPPPPQQTTCSGCIHLSQRVQSLEDNVGWLWNQIHQLQKQLPQSTTSWWQSAPLKSPCETFSSSAQPMQTVTQISTPASNTSTEVNHCDTPFSSTSTDSMTPSQALTEESQAMAEDSESEEVELSKDPAIHCPDDSRIFNGFTVAQLKKKAQRKQTFSRASKELFELMFSEEERLGKSLDGYTRIKKDGTVVQREGLNDQEKLFALQEIIRSVFPEASPRKIKKKLAEKLKPSAMTN